jgi:toxin ParE1/3/4
VGLKWTRAASQDLESVPRYVGRDNLDAAIETVIEIIRRVEVLVEHPGIGRPRRLEGTRELVLGSLHVIPYVHQGDAVTILRVLHGATKWPDHSQETL